MQRSGFCSAYAETRGVARLRVSPSLAFWGLRSLRVLRPPRTPRQAFLALLLVLWDEAPHHQNQGRKDIKEMHKNIEHGGENSYHAQ